MWPRPGELTTSRAYHEDRLLQLPQSAIGEMKGKPSARPQRASGRARLELTPKMTKRGFNTLKLFVFSAFLLGGVGISYRIPLAEPGEGGAKDVPGRIGTNLEHYERTASNDSKTIDARNLPGTSQDTDAGRKERTSKELAQFCSKFALLGTVVDDKNYALAIIGDKELRTQEAYKVGHSIHGGIITDILREKVVIRLRGKELVLEIGNGVHSGSEDAEAKFFEGTRLVTVSLQDMRKAFDALSQPDSHARMVPRSSDLGIGKGGLQILNVEPGSPFDKIGFENRDVIEEVNGTPVGDPFNAVAMYNLMKSVLPGDILSESGLDLQSFLNGSDNGMSIILQKVQKLFHLFQNREDVRMTLTIRRGTMQ